MRTAIPESTTTTATVAIGAGDHHIALDPLEHELARTAVETVAAPAAAGGGDRWTPM